MPTANVEYICTAPTNGVDSTANVRREGANAFESAAVSQALISNINKMNFTVA